MSSAIIDFDPSDESWRCDPLQDAVVLKEKTAETKEIHTEQLEPDVSAFVEPLRLEYTPFTKVDRDLKSYSSASMITEQTFLTDSRNGHSLLTTFRIR